jgi:hypothetical protein
MLKWILSLLPGNVVGAITPFFNPWVLVAILAASSGSFLWATYLAHLRFEAFQDSVEAVGKAQKAIVRYIVRTQTIIDKDIVNGLNRDKARLERDNAAMLISLRKHADSSILPPNAPPPGGDQDGSRCVVPDHLVCFDRTRLSTGIRDARQQAVAGYLEVLGRGDRALVALEACIQWTERQHALNPTGSLTQE